MTKVEKSPVYHTKYSNIETNNKIILKQLVGLIRKLEQSLPIKKEKVSPQKLLQYFEEIRINMVKNNDKENKARIAQANLRRDALNTWLKAHPQQEENMRSKAKSVVTRKWDNNRQEYVYSYDLKTNPYPYESWEREVFDFVANQYLQSIQPS